MASVHSPIRTYLKPFLFRLIGNQGYLWFQYQAKKRDIRLRLVEEKEMATLPVWVRPGDDVIDIGANFGYYSVRLSQLAGPQGNVYAFEPIADTHRICHKILRHFKANNVMLYDCGVGEKNEERPFVVPLQSFGFMSAGQAHVEGRNNQHEGNETYYQFSKEVTWKRHLVSLDTFLLPKLKRLTFVKIDIEGAEYFALKGMTQTLLQFRPVILMEIVSFFLKGYGIYPEQLKQWMQEARYGCFEYDEKQKKLIPATKENWDGNYILIPVEKQKGDGNILEWRR
ncbi:MAG: FkbM family methyltransferase [Deltaproteobacteria bacterium]|nr:FkbM family methyltransferase [Deltaproteobacteria bacterium]